MMGWLNVGSLVLGVAAWAIPGTLLSRRGSSSSGFAIGMFASFVCTLLALLMQLVYTQHLVDIHDWSALLDTHGAVLFAASVLLIVTIGLNGVLLRKVLVGK